MKKIILFILVSIILSSCVTSKFSSGLEKIELGMTKQEVISILGNNYKLMGAVPTPDGNLETLMFYDTNVIRAENGNFMMNFLDGRLDEWHREYPLPQPEPRNENN